MCRGSKPRLASTTPATTRHSCLSTTAVSPGGANSGAGSTPAACTGPGSRTGPGHYGSGHYGPGHYGPGTVTGPRGATAATTVCRGGGANTTVAGSGHR